MNRYGKMFEELAKRGEGAFVPFVVIGDPDVGRSIEIIRTLAESGADALELGLPFSDPIADGPTIQRATVRAIDSGATPANCWKAISDLRDAGVDIPIGILTYANMAVARGVDDFYKDAHGAGVDSVLLADVPCYEAEPFIEAANKSNVEPILIAPPNASDERLREIARMGGAYTYVQARPGVTGARDRIELDQGKILKKLKEFGAPPPIVGFGISKPEHVRAAIDAGAAGAISGSAIVTMVEGNAGDPARLEKEISAFVKAMKEATR